MLSIKVVLLFMAAYARVDGALLDPRLCVFSGLEDCVRRAEADPKLGAAFQCRQARDNIECLKLLSDGKMDIVKADPEEMFIADNLQNARQRFMRVLAQIKPKERADDEFQYETVAIVKNDASEDIENFKSCHSGMNTASYHIPVAGLLKKSELHRLSNKTVTVRENELQSLSKLFNQACIPGQWTNDPALDQIWKSKYSKLCQLCEQPEKCSYTGESGDEGALKCLIKKGDIAWVKLDAAKKFFGVNGAKTENDPSLYSYLCFNLSKMPVTTNKPCTWGAKPWPGYLFQSFRKEKIQETAEHYKNVILNLYGQNDPEALKLLGLKNGEKPIFSNTALTPKEYLDKGRYHETVGKATANPGRNMVMYVLDTDSGMKCHLMSYAFFIRGIRPMLQCKKAESLKAVEEQRLSLNSLMFVADAEQALVLEKDVNMKPILHEVYGESTQVEIVAVLKYTLENVKNFKDLKGKTACLPRNNTAAFKSIVKYMLDNKFIQKDICPYEKAMKEFFKDVEYENTEVNECSDTTVIDCLFCRNSEVIFLPLEIAKKISEEKKTSVDILCPNGVTKPIKEAKDCALVKIPPKMVMIKKDAPGVQEYEIKTALTEATKLFNEHPEQYKMFGEYKEKYDILFTDHATNLESVVGTIPSFETYKSNAINYCETK